MIVWGGYERHPYSNTGGRYNPGTDSWIADQHHQRAQLPSDHTAVWTGSEMIVWGGCAADLRTPAADTIRAPTVGPLPARRTRRLRDRYHTAVWTGSEMIVWGGLTSTTI